MTTAAADRPLDVLVIGGGAAGLAAAVALARFGRTVEVVDAGAPRNAAAGGVHNLLGREGIAPGDLVARGRAELIGYGGRVTPDTAVDARRLPDGGFEVDLTAGGRRHADRLVVAAGVRDRLPDVDGLAARWGRDVIHCPFCHGYEVRGQRVAVLVTTPLALHQAAMFRELTPAVTAVIDPAVPVEETERAALAAVGVAVVDAAASAVLVEADRLVGVRLADGGVLPCDAVVVAPTADPACAVLDALGVARAEGDPRVGYVHDATGGTAVPGVWVAGNSAEPYAPVAGALASGLTAAAGVVAGLVAQRRRAAVAPSGRGLDDDPATV